MSATILINESTSELAARAPLGRPRPSHAWRRRAERKELRALRDTFVSLAFVTFDFAVTFAVFVPFAFVLLFKPMDFPLAWPLGSSLMSVWSSGRQETPSQLHFSFGQSFA